MDLTVDPIQAARDAGFDLDLIDTNLALTPEQRLKQHDDALELMLELRKACDAALNAKLHSTAAAAS